MKGWLTQLAGSAATCVAYGRYGQVISAFFLLGFPAISSACPICDTSTGQEVRSGITGEGSGTAVVAISFPFIVLLAGLRVYNVGMKNFFRRLPPR